MALNVSVNNKNCTNRVRGKIKQMISVVNVHLSSVTILQVLLS